MMGIEVLFDNIVVMENGCFEWRGGYNKWGYGQVRFNGRVQQVHKLMYEFFNGSVPDGLELDHFKCDNRGCCRIGHLKPVTHKENVLRGNSFSAIKARQTECIRGHSLLGDNVYIKSDGHRRCRICRKKYNKEYWKIYYRPDLYCE